MDLSKYKFLDPLAVIGCIFLGFITKSYVVGFGSFIGYLVFKGIMNSAARTTVGDQYRGVNGEQFKRFGTTLQERERNVNIMFEQQNGTLGFAQSWDFDGWDGQKSVRSSLAFKISRHIRTMEEKEQHYLKIAILLYNSGHISEAKYNYYMLAFVNGNGKASVESFTYRNSYESFKDGPGVVKFYVDKQDASVESAINRILKDLDEIENNKDLITPAPISKNPFLLKNEIQNSIFKKTEGGYGLKLGSLDGEELTYGEEGSLITIAPPGSGKTQCFVLPNLLTWPGAAVVLDVGGAIYEATHKWRSENVGPVYKFSPLQSTDSNSYNPLAFVRKDVNYIWSDSKLLAEMMIVSTGSDQNKFWDENAKEFLTATIAYVCFYFPENERVMKNVMNVLSGKDQKMIGMLKATVSVDPMEQAGYYFEKMESKTLGSVIQTARSNLAAWQEPLVSQITQKSDWHPLDLRKSSDKPPTIYICVRADGIDQVLSILRVFIAQHLQVIFNDGPLPGKRVPGVLFMLDEFPRLKNMPPVDMALNVGAAYRIRVWMFAQSYGQLKESYQNAEGMTGACAVRIYMNIPLQDELATTISRQLGEKKNIDTGILEPILPVRVLCGPEFNNYSLIVATNTKPAKVQKAYAWQNEELKARMV